MKAIPIKPVIMNAIPVPCMRFGIFEYLIFSLMAAMPMMAMSQPIPEPKPYASD